MKWMICLVLCAVCNSNGQKSKDTSKSVLTPGQREQVDKLRSELNAAFEAGEGVPAGVIVQPEWTKQGSTNDKPISKVIVNESTLKETKALRTEITEAVVKQGHTEDVLQLEAAIKAKSTAPGSEPIVTSARNEMLGSSQESAANVANVVDATPLDIDLAKLHQLELSKRRTREMLVLSRIEEDLQFTLGSDVSHWLQLQQNGSLFLLGRRSQDVLLFQQLALSEGSQFRGYEALQPLSVPAGIDAMLSYERWNLQAQLQETLVLLATQQQLLWYRLEAGMGLAQFWHWPLGSSIDKLLPFVVENREYLALIQNRTLSIYAYDVDGMEFWIVQRMQLEQTISALAVQDTGRDLLLAVGQANEALIYAHNMRELSPDAGLQLQLRQRVDAPKIADIAAFQMGGHSYVALGGLRPQILAYVQGQLVPRTLLGQNFGLVELFLPVPVRTYRDDLLLLVQHRVFFDTHTLIQLEVLVWNGEAFEASLPAPCQLGTHTRYGAGCMLDEMRDAGLTGSVLLRHIQPPLLLVPRQAAPSGLFRLHTELLPRNSELHDLQEIHNFMKQWVDEQDKLIQLAEQLLQMEHHAEPELIHYEEINTPLLINEGATLDALHVNGIPWTVQDSAVDLYELLQEMRLLHHQIMGTNGGRMKRQPQLFRYDYEKLEFDIVEAQELYIDRLNHVPFYVQNATLEFNGSINTQLLDLMRPQAIEQAESLPSSTQQRLQLDADLSFQFINGLEWAEFIQQLVWRHEPLRLSQLRVAGAVVFEDSLHLSALNGLSFPDDYLWSQGSTTTIVHSPKQFTQTLSANMVDTDGSINGRDPADAITLSDAQDWPGLVTFTQLEVSEQLELNGSAQGRQFEEAPLNSMLTDSHRISAACHFVELIVNGPVHLRGLLDNSSFDALLGDLVQRPADPNDELLITGSKHVQQLALPVDAHVLDGTLNGIPIEQFVTKHTEQTLHNLSTLDGYVYFHQLQLSGSYDGVHLEQLMAQALRVDAPLVAPTTRLQFTSEPPQLTELHVTHALNHVPLSSGYQRLHEPLYLSQARFERLQAEQLDVADSVVGAGRLNGHNLSELLSKEPRVDIVQVQELILPMGVQATQLQGINAELLLGFLRQLDELPLLILHGQLQVEHIAVSGAVLVDDALNGRNMAQLQRDVVWLDRPNKLGTRWRFQQAPIFDSDVFLQGSYNERLLPELLNDIVFRSDPEQELLIVGTKSFAGPVIIQDTLQLQALNGVPFDRLANKLLPLEFDGQLHLDGNLYAEHLQLQGDLNGQPVDKLEKLLHWDTQLGAFVHRGLIRLPAQGQLQELTVLGRFGNRSLEPLQEFFADLVYKRQPQLSIEGHKVFTGRVHIQGGAHIVELNGLKLEQLLQQIVFIDGKEVTLQSPVHFEAPVEMNELQLGQLVLQGELLNGCNITEWIHDTLRVDRNWQPDTPVKFAPGALDNNALQVAQLNEIKLDRIVTLHTQQNLSLPLVAKELHLADGHVKLEGRVNGRNLSMEYANTLLISAPQPQRVTTPLVIASIDVTGSLLASAPINGDPNFNLSNVATLHEEQLCLQTPLNFAQLHAPELRTDLQINGFNFSAWHERSLWAQGRATQVISGNWSVRWLRVKQPQVAEQTAHEIYRRQSEWAERYQQLCRRLSRLLGLLRLPYHVTQLRRSFALQQAAGEADIRRVFALQSAPQGASYLLLNEVGCWTRIYRWNGKQYIKSGNFESGPIDDVTVLQLRNASSANGNDQFSFMTSYETSEEQLERSWNCSSLANLQSWRTSAEIEIEPMGVPASKLQQLLQKHEAQQRRRGPSYQDAIKYLNRPTTESHLRPHLDAIHALSQEQYETLRQRLLQHLSFRLQTEVNITQLSIPESDLYDDEHLVEDFLGLMRQLRLASRSGSEAFAALPTDSLPLPNTPGRVLAARTAQLIWSAVEELNALRSRLASNDSQLVQEQHSLGLHLSSAIRDVLLLANVGSHEQTDDGDEDTRRLHAVIGRLRELQHQIQEAQQLDLDTAETSNMMAMQPHPHQQWRPVETIRLHVGPAQHARLLYARLTTAAADAPPIAPSTAPGAHVQLHFANGTIFQSLAADLMARQLTALRVRDETLLAFVEGCCLVRVFIYRGIQGFVPFTQFHAEADEQTEQPGIQQLLALRLPLSRSPGALYLLAVAQARRVTFYELVMPGFFEPWLHCN
ncbi:hypothetical protein AWZ03_012334 [Drosophila navojoa]|uniref:VWFD domain-containing protein n=1 Tax=Drosophila navojoa TaxID=7232 RepID=A0A484AZJ7_DRONA|nr:uncharacterized protein LOC108656103 [Drosophila navojoa]TDG41250.1 hypothetical protein AWZ03_012334 [Drosophila navojoa]